MRSIIEMGKLFTVFIVLTACFYWGIGFVADRMDMPDENEAPSGRVMEVNESSSALSDFTQRIFVFYWLGE